LVVQRIIEHSTRTDYSTTWFSLHVRVWGKTFYIWLYTVV